MENRAVVLLHDNTGTLAAYRALIPELCGPSTVLGLAVTDLDGYLGLDPSTLIDQLAAGYAEVLLAQQHRAYHLVGYCMGGVLATEVARRLADSGGEVGSLNVVSGHPAPCRIEDELLIEYSFVKSLGMPPAVVGYPADDEGMAHAIRFVLNEAPGALRAGRLDRLSTDEFGLVGPRFRELRSLDQATRLTAIATSLSQADIRRPDRLSDSYRVFRHGLQGITLHRTGPYSGDITYFRDSGHAGCIPGLRDEIYQHWADICLGNLRVVDLAGDQFNCLSRHHLHHLVTLLRREGAW